MPSFGPGATLARPQPRPSSRRSAAPEPAHRIGTSRLPGWRGCDLRNCRHFRELLGGPLDVATCCRHYGRKSERAPLSRKFERTSERAHYERTSERAHHERTSEKAQDSTLLPPFPVTSATGGGRVAITKGGAGMAGGVHASLEMRTGEGPRMCVARWARCPRASQLSARSHARTPTYAPDASGMCGLRAGCG